MLLYQKGYDPYIDFLKGYMILCILFTHACYTWAALRDYTLYSFWGCAPTGCFLLISAMHFYRKGYDGVNYSLSRHVVKVIFPYLMVQLLLFSLLLFIKPIYYYESLSFFSLFKSGGYGMGSYFPWVYFQYILLMMLLTPIIKRIKSEKVLLMFFLLLSVSIEFLCSIFYMDDEWYRITVLRCPFLIYLGIILVKYGISLSKWRIVISVISGLFIIIFVYGKVNLEPVFYNTAWKTYHWVCYPYLTFFLTFLVYLLYRKTGGGIIAKNMLRIGRASYGIFLFQLVWFMLPIQVNNLITTILYIITSMFFCTICGILLKEKVMDVFLYR